MNANNESISINSRRSFLKKFATLATANVAVYVVGAVVSPSNSLTAGAKVWNFGGTGSPCTGPVTHEPPGSGYGGGPCTILNDTCSEIWCYPPPYVPSYFCTPVTFICQ